MTQSDQSNRVELVLDNELVEAIDRILSDGGIDPITPEHRAGAIKEMAAAWLRELKR